MKNLSQQQPTRRNTSKQGGQTHPTCCTQQSVAMCCVEMLGRLAGAWNWSNFSCNFLDVAWCCSRLDRFMQQCCTQTYALDFQYPTYRNTLQQDDHNALYVMLKCCDRSAEACKCWAIDVIMICCENDQYIRGPVFGFKGVVNHTHNRCRLVLSTMESGVLEAYYVFML